ncbi:MAG TPA: hypothetical protein VK920_00615, partial [Solirubrobacterales bacterium]|nr:hypothetical protein [Solirubrobacterales bacterium]
VVSKVDEAAEPVAVGAGAAGAEVEVVPEAPAPSRADTPALTAPPGDGAPERPAEPLVGAGAGGDDAERRRAAKRNKRRQRQRRRKHGRHR